MRFYGYIINIFYIDILERYVLYDFDFERRKYYILIFSLYLEIC